MATHIDKVANSYILSASKLDFWGWFKEGRLLFCSGNVAISRAIERCTGSPWSHVAMVIKVYSEWCVLEAVADHGVTITPIWRYIDLYPGDLVLCKREINGVEFDQMPAILRGINQYISRAYAKQGLVREALHLWDKDFPPEMNGTECYCSGLQWLMSQATPYPLQNPHGGAPTPEDLFTDPTVIPICALLYEAAAQGASNHG